MKYSNMLNDPLHVNVPIVGISGGLKKLDLQVIEKVKQNHALTPANKRRLKKLESLRGSGFWGDFATGFKTGVSDGLNVASKAADVAVKLAPLLAAAGKVSELDKAKESLKKFVNKEKKTKPTKKHLDLLEKAGIITKTVTGGNFITDATKGVSKAAKSTQKFAKDNKKEILMATDLIMPEAAPVVGLALKAAGKTKRPPSRWVVFVKEFAAKHDMKYADALKAAAKDWKASKGK